MIGQDIHAHCPPVVPCSCLAGQQEHHLARLTLHAAVDALTTPQPEEDGK